MSEQIKQELEDLLYLGRKMSSEEFEAVLDDYLPTKTEEEKNTILSSVEEKGAAALGQLKAIDSEIAIMEKFNGIEDFVKLSKIAETYFGKSKAWLYHRLHGHKIHGKPAQFTDKEKQKLSEALLNISNDLKAVALKIV